MFFEILSNNNVMDKKGKKEKEDQSLSEELDQLIERKKTENSALKKIYESLQKSRLENIEKKEK